MRKKILYILVFILMFSMISNVNAIEEVKDPKFETANDGNSNAVENPSIKKYSNEDMFIYVDKSSIFNSSDKTVVYEIPLFKDNELQYNYNTLKSCEGSNRAACMAKKVYFYVNSNSPAVMDSNKWWGSLLFCQYVDYEGPDDIGAVLYTDSFAAEYGNNDGNLFSPFKGDLVSNCVTVLLDDENVSNEDIIYTCDKYSEYRNSIEELIAQYTKEPTEQGKTQYINDYNKHLEILKSLCKNSLTELDYTDSCVQSCLNLKVDIKLWDKQFGLSGNDNLCDFNSKLMKWLKNILKWIKYIVPVLVIVLGILDFIRAIASGSDDEMKKAQGRFIKRLIAAALLFIIPFIIEFLLTSFKIIKENPYCGILD